MDKEIKFVEVARSFSFKLNLGDFQNADFFCSQKAEVPEKEAEKVSEALYEFCKKEVMKSVNSFRLAMQNHKKGVGGMSAAERKIKATEGGEADFGPEQS